VSWPYPSTMSPEVSLSRSREMAPQPRTWMGRTCLGWKEFKNADSRLVKVVLEESVKYYTVNLFTNNNVYL
jgi:hypothetical protein